MTGPMSVLLLLTRSESAAVEAGMFVDSNWSIVSTIKPSGLYCWPAQHVNGFHPPCLPGPVPV